MRIMTNWLWCLCFHSSILQQIKIDCQQESSFDLKKEYTISMDTYEQTQIFFFISSVGFIILGILSAIFLIYLIRTMNTFSRIMDKMEKNLDEISDEAKDLIEDVRESMIFRFLFGKK